MSLPWLVPEIIQFPPLQQALEEPNGLLAAGGSLSCDWLLHAYRLGIFPWFEQGQPILWWSPDPRLVLFPDQIRISRSLARLLRRNPYSIRMDSDFGAVIHQCGRGRAQAAQTWITAEMEQAYLSLHEQGYAHSVEIWDEKQLVGGLYGIALGKVFFGESMFSAQPNTSKLALVALAQQLRIWQFALIDCQVSSEHLVSMGAREIPRDSFIQILDQNLGPDTEPGRWQFDENFQVSAGEI